MISLLIENGASLRSHAAEVFSLSFFEKVGCLSWGGKKVLIDCLVFEGWIRSTDLCL